MPFADKPPNPLAPARASFIAPETRWYVPPGPFLLESGARLERLQVAYRTWGRLSPAGDNAVVVCHAFTGSADADRWWIEDVRPGARPRPGARLRPLRQHPGELLRHDRAGLHRPGDRASLPRRLPGQSPCGTWSACRGELCRALGVQQIRSVIGGSLGGMQVLEWALLFPDLVRSVGPHRLLGAPLGLGHRTLGGPAPGHRRRPALGGRALRPGRSARGGPGRGPHDGHVHLPWMGELRGALRAAPADRRALRHGELPALPGAAARRPLRRRHLPRAHPRHGHPRRGPRTGRVRGGAAGHPAAGAGGDRRHRRPLRPGGAAGDGASHACGAPRAARLPARPRRLPHPRGRALRHGLRLPGPRGGAEHAAPAGAARLGRAGGEPARARKGKGGGASPRPGAGAGREPGLRLRHRAAGGRGGRPARAAPSTSTGSTSRAGARRSPRRRPWARSGCPMPRPCSTGWPASPARCSST